MATFAAATLATQAAVVGATAAVVGTAVSLDASRDAAEASKERGQVASASQKNRDAAAIRQQAREERIRRAKIAQVSVATGTSGSSREFGATSALQTQFSASAGNVAGQQKTAEGISGLNQDIADANVRGAAGGALKSLGSMTFNAAGGFDNLFKGS